MTGHGRAFKIMQTLVGTDLRVTTVEKSKTRVGSFFRWRCTCPRKGGDWTRSEQAQAIAVVHAVTWHGAELGRGLYRNPNTH